jgi:L-ascorbate metabolism protein UlaG (beta-lactamase superfamily)
VNEETANIGLTVNVRKVKLKLRRKQFLQTRKWLSAKPMRWLQAFAEELSTSSFNQKCHITYQAMSMSIEKTTPEKNEIAFKWFNHYAGVTIKTPTKTLVIDPVDVNAKNFTTIDAILITHEHYDHLDGPLIRKMQERTNCQILADPTSTRKLSVSIPPEKLQEMNPGTETKIDDVTVRAETCNHPPANTPITFLITSEDGVKIFHTADSLPFPEMKDIGKDHKPDLVFCTVGIAPGTSPQTGVEIVKLVKPKVAVPYHTASKDDLKKFCELLKKEAPKVACKVAKQGNVYIVGKAKKR